MTLVIQMHGVPGSGKSTVARALAPLVEGIVLDKDVIKSALLRSGATEALAGPAAYEVYFSLAERLAAQTRTLILDSPVFWPRVEERWLQLASDAGSRALLIECVCGDERELRRRLATRDGLESNPREPIDLLQHRDARATSFQPRLVLDTLRPLDEIVAAALDYVRVGVPG